MHAAAAVTDQPDDDPLRARLRAVGAEGPVFMLADNAAIASGAPRWARLLAEAGRSHRVRYWEGPAGAAAIAALAAEARGFNATVIVAAGAADTVAAAGGVASTIGVPRVIDPAWGDDTAGV